MQAPVVEISRGTGAEQQRWEQEEEAEADPKKEDLADAKTVLQH